jgi:hypothetical protein
MRIEIPTAAVGLARFLLLAAGAAALACGGGGGDVAGPDNTVEVVVVGDGRVTCSTSASLDCPPSCGPLDWSPGATVTLAAVPGTNRTFVGWSGACAGTSACQFVVNGHMKVTATFQ